MDHEKEDASLLTASSASPPSCETFEKIDALETLALEKEISVADDTRFSEASNLEEAKVRKSSDHIFRI